MPFDACDPPDGAAGLRPHTREQLAHLLAEAAELEHNLLCCYLYAAFSLKRRGQPGLADADAPLVERWRGSIMQVAMEEMAHLALIANLTLAIGARPHFNRPNLPVAPLYHPAGIVVELAPFDLDTLDHFIYLERPEGTELPDGASFAVRHDDYRRGERPGASLMPAAIDYATIGEFYAHLRACLEGLAAEVGERALFCGDASAQVSAGQIDLPGIAAVTDLSSALSALDTIVTQGEGAGAHHEQSHYARFRAIREEFVQARSRSGAFEPAWPAARNPLMRKPADASSGLHVDARDAATVLDLANAVYALTLRLLTQAWSGQEKRTPPGGSRPVAAAALGAAVELMGVLGALGQHLCTLPASASAPGVHAGLSFAMPRAVEPLVEAAALPWIRERLAELGTGLKQVAASQPALGRLVLRLEGKRSRTACEGKESAADPVVGQTDGRHGMAWARAWAWA